MKANEQHRASLIGVQATVSVRDIFGASDERSERREDWGRGAPILSRFAPRTLSATETIRPQVGELACRLLLIDVLPLSEGKKYFVNSIFLIT